MLATVLKALFCARNIYFNDRMATQCFKKPWAIALISSPRESELISVFSSGVSILKSEETKVLPRPCLAVSMENMKCHPFTFPCTWTDRNGRMNYAEAKHEVSMELSSEEKHFYGEVSSE